MHLAFIGIFLITLGIGVIVGFSLESSGVTPSSIIVIDKTENTNYREVFETLITSLPNFKKYDIRNDAPYVEENALKQVNAKEKQAVVLMTKADGMPSFEIITYDYANTNLRSSIMADLTVFHQKIYIIENGIDEQKFYTPSITERALNPNAQSPEEVSVISIVSTAIIILVSMICFPALTVVSNDIIYEKTDRTIELIVSSVSTRTLYLSKIMVGFLLILTEVMLIVVLGIIGIIVVNAFGNLPAFAGVATAIEAVGLINKIIIFGLYLALMLFLYLILVIIVSSLTTDIETAGYLLLIAVLPMTIFSYMALSVPFNPSNSFFTNLLTYLPLSSGFTLPIKIMLDLSSPWEIVISTALLLATTVFIYIIGERIFRKNIIKYSNKMRNRKIKEKMQKAD
jgi:ABC-type Na+ efflux pump permease subunit